MLKSLPLLLVLLALTIPNADAKGLGNFQSDFANVCMSQMQMQSASSGLTIPGSTMQDYCQCTASEVVKNANTNPVLMKMLSDPSTPTSSLEGYFRTAANTCSARHIK